MTRYSHIYGTPPLFPQTNPIGTPYYMPPEQVTDRKSFPASDIWSLGCVLHEAWHRTDARTAQLT